MCGIVAYLGRQQAVPILLQGLKRLEYRGYDSAGFAVLENGKCKYQKEVGNVDKLIERVSDMNFDSRLGLAHTRWATHGDVSIKNAHPHCDCSGKIWLVHNGIIENYKELRETLTKDGHSFISDTDTEVLPHLIEKYLQEDLDIDAAVARTLEQVQGAYAIVIFSSNYPDRLIAASLSNPLKLGIGRDEYFLASDATAILKYTHNIITLEDNELVIITPLGYEIRSLLKQERIVRDMERIDWELQQIEKCGFKHFMQKEIYEQPSTLLETLKGRVDETKGIPKLGGLEDVIDRLKDIKRINIVACGSAYYAGMVGEILFEDIAGIAAKCFTGSEFRYRSIIVDHDSEALLAISQSGETADTLAAVKEANRQGILTLGIVNVVGSAIARATVAGVYTRVGPEIAVASTKAFTAQIIVLALIALLLSRSRKMPSVVGKCIIKELLRLPLFIEEIFKQSNKIEDVAKRYAMYDHFAFMGRRYNYPIALEGALKLKEISYIHAEGYASGELKHGSIALIEEDFPSLFICPKDSVYEKNLSNLEEIKARNGKIIAVGSDGDEQLVSLADDVIFIPRTMEMFSPILTVVPLQLLAYYIARERGCDIDKPRNLAKSVTVE